MTVNYSYKGGHLWEPPIDETGNYETMSTLRAENERLKTTLRLINDKLDSLGILSGGKIKI